MTAGAAVAEGRERPLAAEVSRTGIAYRAAYVALAVAIAIGCVLATPDSAAYALGRFTGFAMLHDHTLPLYLGTESFTADGSYAGAIGWLGALGTALLSNLPPAASLFATALVALATFAFVELRARRVASRGLALGAVALAGLCAVGSFGVAGGIVTAAFASALAYILDRPSPRAAALATVLAIVWCNTAPQGLLAPAIALCAIASVWFGAATALERRYALLAFAGTVLATLATPALFAYPALAFEAMRVDRELMGVIASVNPVDVVPFAYRAGFTLVVFAAFALGIRRGREGAIPLLLFGALLALANGAYVVVFGVLAAPLLAGSAAAAFPRFTRPGTAAARGDLVALGCAVAVALFGAWQAAAHFTPLTGGYALAASLAADGKSHRVYCTNVDWCNAALAGAPNVRVFMDGRVAAYPEATRDRKRDIGNLKPQWRKRLADDGVDAIVAAGDRAFSGLVALSPGWYAAATDDGTVLYERTGTAR
jgi:hypothetical protein